MSRLRGPRLALFAAGVATVVLGLSWVTRIRLHWLGDQAIWLRSLNGPESQHPVEPLSFALVLATRDWLPVSPGSVPAGPLVLSVLMGGGFLLLTWILSGEVERISSSRRIWLWAVLSATPHWMFYRGYVESYPFLLLALLLSALILLRTIRGRGFHWVWPAAVMASGAHLMGVGSLLPAVYVGFVRRINRVLLVGGAVAVTAVVMLWFLSKRAMVHQMTSTHLAWMVFDLSDRGWDRFLGLGHLRLLANNLLLFGGPLLWTSFLLPWAALWRDRRQGTVLWILFVVPGLLGLLLVRLLLGEVRDWDLFASYMYFLTPLLATAWLARRADASGLPRFSATLLCLAFSHALLWGSVDIDADRGIARAERLYGAGSLLPSETRGPACEEIAIAERMRGNVTAQLKWYRLASDAMPRHYRYHQNLGAVALGLGRTDEAEEAFREAVLLGSPNPAPYHSLGFTQLQRGQAEPSLDTFTRGLANAGPDPRLYHGRGVALSHLGDFPAAAAALDSSLALAPDDPRTLLYRGIVFMRTDAPRDAVTSIQRAVTLDPEVPEGWRFLAQAARQAGDTALAEEARRQAEARRGRDNR